MNSDVQVMNVRKFIRHNLDSTCSAAITSYLQNRVFPNLRQNATAGRPGWTSNNVESMHNALKSYTNWRMQRLPELVNSIKGIVDVHRRNVERAMYGEGELHTGFVLYTIRLQCVAL